MEKRNRPMKIIKRILRIAEPFGESFTFRYKDEDKLSTVLGGVICIIFYVLAIIYVVYNFIPFVNSENFSLQYYTMNLNRTEKVKLSEPPSAFAFGLSQEKNNKSNPNNIFDLLDIKVEFSTLKSNTNKTKKDIDYGRCNNNDFHNLHNDSFYDLNIINFNCISRDDLSNNNPEGIYTDEIFSYYIISVESKHPNNSEHNKLINDFLLENDCKLQFFYTDIIINLDDTDNPFSSVLNSMFIQLNPTLIQKRNIFFMNYHLIDDKSLIHLKRDEEIPTLKTGLSRIEDYSLYKGLNRTEKITDDYNFYAKFYIRVDNRKIEVKRRYQDFMEFYADTSALLLSIFWFLGVIFAYYDRIKANHSISKKLFYFEGTKNNNFEQFQKLKNILNSEQLEEKNLEDKTKSNLIDNNNLEENNIVIKNIKDNNKIEEIKGESGNVVPYSRNNPNSNDTLPRKQTKSLLINQIEEKEKNTINFSSYNIFEMFWSFKICCKTKNFENKISLIQKSKSIIDEKLDIVFYIRNMILFELINKIYFEDMDIINFLSRPIIYFKKEEEDKKDEFNFEDIGLVNEVNESNVISERNEGGKTEENNEETGKKTDLRKGRGELYKSAYKFDFYILSRRIKNLIREPNKTKNESKLINLLDEQLKGI